MRYQGVVHKKVAKGGEDHIGLARTLLGQLENRIKNSRGQITQLSNHMKTPDGWDIHVGIVGGQHYLHITPVLEKPKGRIKKEALFTYKPFSDYPQAVIWVEVDETGISPVKTFSLYFNENVRAGASHSQGVKDEEELILSMQRLESESYEDESYAYTYMAYYKVYAGGYTLFDSPDYALIGAAEIPDECFVFVLYDYDLSTIKFITHPRNNLNFDSTDYDTPIIDAADCTTALDIPFSAFNPETSYPHFTMCSFDETGTMAYIGAFYQLGTGVTRSCGDVAVTLVPVGVGDLRTVNGTYEILNADTEVGLVGNGTRVATPYSYERLVPEYDETADFVQYICDISTCAWINYTNYEWRPVGSGGAETEVWNLTETLKLSGAMKSDGTVNYLTYEYNTDMADSGLPLSRDQASSFYATAINGASSSPVPCELVTPTAEFAEAHHGDDIKRHHNHSIIEDYSEKFTIASFEYEEYTQISGSLSMTNYIDEWRPTGTLVSEHVVYTIPGGCYSTLVGFPWAGANQLCSPSGTTLGKFYENSLNGYSIRYGFSVGLYHKWEDYAGRYGYLDASSQTVELHCTTGSRFVTAYYQMDTATGSVSFPELATVSELDTTITNAPFVSPTKREIAPEESTEWSDTDSVPALGLGNKEFYECTHPSGYVLFSMNDRKCKYLSRSFADNPDYLTTIVQIFDLQTNQFIDVRTMYNDKLAEDGLTGYLPATHLVSEYGGYPPRMFYKYGAVRRLPNVAIEF